MEGFEKMPCTFDNDKADHENLARKVHGNMVQLNVSMEKIKLVRKEVVCYPTFEISHISN